MQPFYALAIHSLLTQPGEAIIDLESEYVAFEDAALLAKLKADFQPFPQVVLLLPSPDVEESARVLRQREMAEMDSVETMNAFFVDHPSNQALAKHTFYTNGKTPEQTSDEIIARLDLSEPQPIILIGPMGAGKSTLGLLLSRKLDGRRSTSRMPALLDYALTRPIISARMIAEELRITQRAAQDLVGELGLREATGRGRYRAWGIL